MQILSVTDNEFRKYGRIVDNIDFTALVEELKRTPIPAGVVYEPAVKELEALPVRLDISEVAYGEMPVQIGYCNGHNSKLNALEYHRDSEINVAATDMILMLGLLTDVEKDHTYDTSKVKAFLVPAGTAVEVYATTLHYAPCTAEGENGFRCVVVLPKGTNTELDFAAGAEGEDRLLAAKNKWLIAHEEAGIVGAFCGLKGENVTV